MKEKKMARTLSKMLALGTQAPDFSLPDTEGKIVSLKNFSQKPLLVMFICNHCPFVKHLRKDLAKLSMDYSSEKMGIVAINSNDAIAYPEDNPEKMKAEKKDAGYLFPYLFDESQEVAKAYDAACTPDFYLFDSKHRLVYRGQFDDSRPNTPIPVTGSDIRGAINAVLHGKTISSDQKPSLGCNIKWRSYSPN
jgi:peroxiredoxin